MQFSTGTGFFIHKDGYLITGHHVISRCTDYSVYARNSTMRAELVAVDEEHDLALLKATFPSPYVAPFRPSQRALASGDAVWVYGYPQDAWKTRDPVLRAATLLEQKGAQGEDWLVQISRSVEQGNSGGPLLDDLGRVVGVIAAKATLYRIDLKTHKTETLKQSELAVNLPTLLGFIERNDIALEWDGSVASPLGEREIAEQAQRFVVNVRCEIR